MGDRIHDSNGLCSPPNEDRYFPAVFLSRFFFPPENLSEIMSDI